MPEANLAYLHHQIFGHAGIARNVRLALPLVFVHLLSLSDPRPNKLLQPTQLAMVAYLMISNTMHER